MISLLYIHPEDTKKALFHNEKVIKGIPNLTSPFVHTLFTINLIKQTSEKYKSSRGAASGNRTHIYIYIYIYIVQKLEIKYNVKSIVKFVKT